MYGALAEYAFNEVPFDGSTPDLFREILQNPEVRLQYLIELYPYNTTKQGTSLGEGPIGTMALSDIDYDFVGGEEVIYISDSGFVTEPDDTPANRSYLALTDNPYQFDVSILSGEDFGGSVPSFGAIRLLNGDKYFEDILDYYWEGRKVVVLVGGEDFTRDEFVTVFDGLCSGIEWDEDQIIINIQNKSKFLETEFTQMLYEGTGGLEGGEDIEGTPKPLLFGECLNVTAVQVDATNLIYQVHDGSIEEIVKLYDKGIELTNEGDVADITATSVSAGQFKTQLSGGYIKLGSSPAGTITADVKGDNTGSYSDGPGEIIRRLLTTKLGSKNLSDSDYNAASITLLDQEVSGVGVYIRNIGNLRDILDSILTPLQCYWTFTRTGIFNVGVVRPPSSPNATITDVDIVDGEIELLQSIEPTWRTKVYYGRSWTVQNADVLAAAATNDFKSFASEEFRININENRDVRSQAISFKEKIFRTPLVNEADAITLQTRLTELHGVKRSVYRLRVYGLIFKSFVGETINVTLDRFGLDEGKDFIVTSISEDAESGQSILEIWG